MNYVQLPDEVLPKVRNWSAMQLAIWADVHTMNKAGMTYYRTNEQLAERWGADDRTVRRVVSQLIACGAVTAEQDGKRRILVATTDFEERKRTKLSPDKSVPGPTSPRTNQSAKEDQLVRDGGPTGPEKEDQLVPQVEHIVEQEEEQVVEKGADDHETIVETETIEAETVHELPATVTPDKPKAKRKTKERQFHDVIMPWDTETFKAAWREWLDYKWDQHRFSYASERYEQTALHQLNNFSKNDERVAIHIIATSIASGWRGLIANSAKSYNGPRTGRSGYFHSSGKYEHPAEVLKDRDIWG